MWNSRRNKEAANQELISFVLESRGGYHKDPYKAYDKFDAYGWERSWPGRNAAMFINDILSHGADINCRDSMGNTPLIHAASGRDPELAFALFRHYKADINAENTYGDTALNLALVTGHAGLAEELLLAGAITTGKNVKGETPADLAAKSASKDIQELVPYLKGEKPLSEIADLRKKQEINGRVWRAARAGRVQELKFAVQEQGGDINAVDAKGCTALMIAYGLDTVKTLIELGAKLDTQDAEGRTALMHAAENGRPERVAALLKAGADISIADKKGQTAADTASGREVLDMLEDEVVKRGGNTPALVAERDKKRTTRALFDAMYQGETLAIPGLLKEGADPYANHKGQNALTYSIRVQQQSATAVLIAAGVDVNKADANGETPLYAAFSNRRSRAFEALLKNGANPNVAGADGESLLHTAIARGESEFTRLLIENKADITTPSQKGLSPLAAIVLLRNTPQPDTIKALSAAGANLNEQDADGNTLLLRMLRQGRDHTSWALLQAGADVTIKNAKGETALEICAKYSSGGIYNEIKKREDAARDQRIADLEEQVKLLGGDITKTPSAAAKPGAKPASPGKAP